MACKCGCVPRAFPHTVHSRVCLTLFPCRREHSLLASFSVLEGPHQHVRVTGAGPQQDLSLLLSSFPGCLDFCSCIGTTMLSFAGVPALVTWDEAISVLPVHPHAPQSFLLCPYVDTFSVLLECVGVGPAPWFALGGVCYTVFQVLAPFYISSKIREVPFSTS